MNYGVDTIELQKKMAEKRIRTIGELSQKCGVNRNTLSDVLNQKTRPSTAVMYKLATVLEMSPEMAGKIFFSQNLHNT